MEVVSYGHIKPKDAYCRKCGAWLRYTRTDVSHRMNTSDYVIKCPACGGYVNAQKPLPFGMCEKPKPPRKIKVHGIAHFDTSAIIEVPEGKTLDEALNEWLLEQVYDSDYTLETEEVE